MSEDRTLEQPLLAVMFADVAGSTKLYETAGDAAAHAAINECIDLMRHHTVAAGGRVIKTIGDEIMSVFPSAEAVTGAAIEIQFALSQRPPLPGGATLGVRIGFYAGPVIERDNDVFGDTVNMAARLTELAQKAQIITARESVNLLPRSMTSMTRFLYAMPVKGKAKDVELFEVIWQPNEEMTMMAGSRGPSKRAPAVLRLKHGDREIMLEGTTTSVTVGRDPNADIPVKDKMSSRAHGRVERRLDKFILSDHSANGTYVTVEGDREIVLRREEFTLRGHGWISFGQPMAECELLLEFWCTESD